MISSSRTALNSGVSASASFGRAVALGRAGRSTSSLTMRVVLVGGSAQASAAALARGLASSSSSQQLSSSATTTAMTRRMSMPCLCAATCDHSISLRKTVLMRNSPANRAYSTKSYPPHILMAMPALSPTMTQGNIGAWRKKVGDQVSQGDVLVEIETDKAQMDFECQEEGYLAKVFIDAGTKDVTVGLPLCILTENKEDVDQFADFAVAGAAPPAPKAAEASPAPSAAPSSPAPASPAPTSAPAAAAPVEAEHDGRVLASPAARFIAASKGIPLEKVKGTGPHGRIIKADVEGYKPEAAAAAKAPAAAHAPVLVSGAAYEDIPLSNVRKVIATRLTESKQEVPHYYLTVELNAEKLISLREKLNGLSNGAYKLSVNDFVIKAAALSLRDVPEVNSSWQGSFIRRFKTSDIAVAVATETGLITPIVPQVEAKGLSVISNKVKELAGKAKDGKLMPEEYQGGSFTISNLGMFGIKHFTAIINPPQGAILAVGGTEDKVVVDASSEKGFRVTQVFSVTLSCDHRVVDGAVGAKWLQQFKKYIEDPLMQLL